MKDKTRGWIVIIGIVLVGIIFILPKLGLFSIFGTSPMVFISYSYTVMDAFSGSGTLKGFGSTAPSLTTVPYKFADLTSGNFPVGGPSSIFTYGASIHYGCVGDTCHSDILGIEIGDYPWTSENGRTTIPPFLNIYYTLSGTSTNSKAYYSINTPITCNANGCSGTLLGTRNWATVGYLLIDLSSYTNIDHLYFAVYDKSTDGTSGAGLIDISTDFTIKSSQNCNTPADTNCDNKVSFAELNAYANKWIAKQVNFDALIQAANAWQIG